MIGKKKPTVQELVIEEMKRRGLNTEGVTVIRRGGGNLFWIVRSERVIGTYERVSRELYMTEGDPKYD